MTEPRKQRGGARAGAGRPKTYRGKTRLFSIQVPAAMAIKLRAEARRIGVSRNQFVVSLLNTALGVANDNPPRNPTRDSDRQ